MELDLMHGQRNYATMKAFQKLRGRLSGNRLKWLMRTVALGQAPSGGFLRVQMSLYCMLVPVHQWEHEWGLILREGNPSFPQCSCIISCSLDNSFNINKKAALKPFKFSTTQRKSGIIACLIVFHWHLSFHTFCVCREALKDKNFATRKVNLFSSLYAFVYFVLLSWHQLWYSHRCEMQLQCHKDVPFRSNRNLPLAIVTLCVMSIRRDSHIVRNEHSRKWTCTGGEVKVRKNSRMPT